MWNDILKTIKAQLYERAISPLSGVFVLSWCLWNYRFITVLFSSLSVTEKFGFIESQLFPDWSTYVLRGFLYPLFTTVLIIFLYPYPARYVYEFWRKRQKELKEIRQKIEDETPLTVEESRQIRKQVYALIEEHDAELRKKDDEISKLKETIEAFNKKINSQKQPKLTLEPARNKKSLRLPDEQLRILKHLASNRGTVKLSSLPSFGKNRIRNEFYIGELASRGLVEQYTDEDDDLALSLTHNGKAIAIEYGLV